jgi:hypothetical protein
MHLHLSYTREPYTREPTMPKNVGECPLATIDSVFPQTILDKFIDKLKGVCPLELLPVLAVILSQEDENGAENAFDDQGIYVIMTDSRWYSRLESGSQGLRVNGIDASSTYVKHATEYLGIQVAGTEVRNCTTCAEKHNEVYHLQEDQWQDAGLKESKSSIEKKTPKLSRLEPVLIVKSQLWKLRLGIDGDSVQLSLSQDQLRLGVGSEMESWKH